VAQVGLLIALMRGKDSPKLFFGLAAFLWLAVVVAIYGSGGLPPRLLGPIPINFLPFTAVLAVLFGSWSLSSKVRDTLRSVPLPGLIALWSPSRAARTSALPA
jgi:hypothetical protein